jgi:RNA polymerase sigma factor (sigma-70 family)
MLKLLRSASPEDLFVERYQILMRWSLSLTGNDRAQAEDLVHDAFIQFTVRRSELGAIENTDAYLNRMLRNMYLSQVRRSALIQDSPFSIANFDSAEIGLRTSDARERVDVQDELRQICQYACARKEGSKAGCVLILRFFHSYYPSEIAQVLRTSRKAVDRYLLIARRESKLYLKDPNALRFTSENSPTNISRLGYVRSAGELLTELRNTIFAARKSECLNREELKRLYMAKTNESIDVSVLSHVVSCPNCLDTVNATLGLPLLRERSVDDRLGRDRDVPPDGSGGDGEGGSGTSIVESKKRYERRLKETIEHRPQELRIAVNGFVLGAQQISSEFNKQGLTVNVDEPIGFVEVFSEQGLRLLFFDVDQAIDGDIEQTARAEFDCGRELDLSLSFRGPWPMLNVVYHDPTFEAVESFVEDSALEADAIELEVPSWSIPRPSLWLRTQDVIQSVRDSLKPGFFLRPGVVTAVFALIVVAAITILFRHVPSTPLSAADLLQRAAASEELISNNRDQVTHRVLRLEERSASGQLLSSRRVDVWHSPVKGITARRLYDDGGTLMAGDWRRADGVQTIYHHGKQPQLQLAPEKRGAASINFDNVWQFSPAAKDFSALIGGASSKRASVEEAQGAYGINYATDSNATIGLTKASLVLSRGDLHAIEQTFAVRQGDEVREYRFIEASFERREPNSVAPAVFEPEASLLAGSATRNAKPETNAVAAAPQPVTPFLATPELELQILKQLNQADAFYGEQISLSRTAEGRLRVQGIVESDKRKGEILQALSSVKHNPAVQIQVETVAEAATREARQRASTSNSMEINPVEVEAKSAVPAAPELRAYLSRQKGMSSEALEEEMRRFADRVMGRARQARRHALALKQIAERFSPDDLRALDPEARNQWRAMMSQHAVAVQQELEALRRELQPVFPLASGGDAEQPVSSDSDFARAAKRLFEMTSAVDEAIGKSFSIYASGNTSAPVKRNEFSRSLANATALAQRLGRR